MLNIIFITQYYNSYADRGLYLQVYSWDEDPTSNILD